MRAGLAIRSSDRTVIRIALLGALLLAACTSRGEQQGDAWADTTSPAATVVSMDTVLAGALARFREGLVPTDTFRHASSSAEAAVREFARLVERSDTAGLARLHLSRGEWAWLVYPESRWARPPYRQRPDVAWTLIVERSNGALARLLERRGDRPLRITAWRCDAVPQREGRTTYHGGCAVTYRDERGGQMTERLFSSIVERDGRFKIGSYSNQF